MDSSINVEYGGSSRGKTLRTKIGIGISVHNRHDVFHRTLQMIRKFLPEGAKLVVVDDASDLPVSSLYMNFQNEVDDYHIFPKNVGIAAVKNKCFELLDDCDHIFLFDDDMYPVSPQWWKPYVESEEPHLMYIFEDFSGPVKVNDTATIWNDGKIKAFSHCRGVMCYFDRVCLDIVGGMDVAYGRWGWEHPDLSNRIYNVGLTRWKYADVVGSEKLFYCLDEHRKVKSTVLGQARMNQIARNKPLYEERRHSKEFIPWKPGAVQNVPRGTGVEKYDLLLTSYFTKVNDPQRSRRWDANVNDIVPLMYSWTPFAPPTKMVVLHDCFEDDTFAMPLVHTAINPYFQRWVSYREYLIKNRDSIGKVFCVDATDVEMLQNPFPHMNGQLYTGDEPDKVNSVWLQNHHKHPLLRAFMSKWANKPLLNAGLLGGDIDLVIEFCGKMIDFYAQAEEDAKIKKWPNAGMTDMATFNYVAYTVFGKILSHGPHVNTVFKANERNSTSWFKHK